MPSAASVPAPFSHILQDNAVGRLRPLEGEDLLLLASRDDDRVDGTAADGLQGLLGLMEPGPQVFHLSRVIVGNLAHGELPRQSVFLAAGPVQKDPFRIAHISDEPAQRLGQLLD